MFATHRSFDLETGVKSSTIAVVSTPTNTSVVYHKTLVVDVKHTPKTLMIRLDNGGWDTISTRHVINNTLYCLGVPFMLIRHKGKTLLAQSKGAGQYPSHRDGVPFVGCSTLRVVRS